MKVVLIGGTGRIGSYLVPRLVKAEYRVISISRGLRQPVKKSYAWNDVEKIILDRNEEAENSLN